MLPPGHSRLKLQICRLFHANMCKFDAEIMTGQRSEFIASIIYHVRTTANVVAMCAIVTMMAGDMRTLLDWNTFSFNSNGQVAAHRVTGLIIKRLWRYKAVRCA